MEPCNEVEDRHGEEGRNAGETNNRLVCSKMAELQKLKEKLAKAKDEAVQSWLDSRPLIDELEKLQSELANIKSQSTISCTTISELESQLQTMTISIRSKKEEELKIRTMINRINQSLDKTQEEMEQLKTERDKKHRERLQLKQVLRVRKQSLQAVQLTLRALRLESEAYGASVAEAHRYINCAKTDDSLVKLTEEDYQLLIKRAKEETSLSEWRIAVSMEQKNAAEESRESCTRKLQNLYTKGRTIKRTTQSDGISNQTIEPEGGRHPDMKAEHSVNKGQNDFKKFRAKSFTKESHKKAQEQNNGPSNKNNYLSKKKKISLLSQIRLCLLQKIRRCLK